MKRLISVMLTVSLMLQGFWVFPVSASGEGPQEYHALGQSKAEFVLDEMIVKFKDDTKPFRVVKIPEGRVKEKVREYSRRPDVVYAEPNYYAQAFTSDPYYGYQWNFGGPASGGIGMDQAWPISTGTGAIVAIVDTGIAYENYGTYAKAPDLANTRFVQGYDFVNNDTHANDDNSHGTHVAGTVAQSTDNGIGVAGVAYDASLMPVKVLNKSGSGTYAAIALGIRYAADNGAKVINMSLGGTAGSTTLESALAYAYGKGVTIVAAAGNDGTGTISYPAAYDKYVIAVGATRYDKALAAYSNYGQSLDLVAPGGDTSVDQNGDGYGDGILQNTFNPSTKVPTAFGYYFFQGTSMATPHVAGVAALVIAHGNAVTPDQVRSALQESALDLGSAGWDSTYGYGLLDAAAALDWGGMVVPNTAPVALDQTVTTSVDTPKAITLTGTDADGDTLAYSIVTDPQKGTISGTAPNITYTPDPDYTGSDSFTFKVSDGKDDSNIATVSLTITPLNVAPVANDQPIQVVKNTSKAIVLTGSDVNGDPLTYSIVQKPSHGKLSGTAPNVTYKPDRNYVGTDSFTFRIYDGKVYSNVATVTITVK